MSNCMEQVVSYNNQVSAIDNLLLNLDKKKELAKILISSGLIPKNLDTPEKVLVCLFRAQEIGVPPMEALSSMPVINGKVTLQGNLILSLISRSHNISQLKIQPQETQCTVTMSRKDYDLTHTVTFTLDEAKKAGLLDKQIWRQYTKIMLQWRAVAMCARVVFPDIMSGLYTPEEIASVDDIHGTVDVNGDLIIGPSNGKSKVVDVNVSGQASQKETPAQKIEQDIEKLAAEKSVNNVLNNSAPNESDKPAEKKTEKPSDKTKTNNSIPKSDPVLNIPYKPDDKPAASDKPKSDPAPSNIDEIEVLLDQGSTWNGKIYRGNTVYIANKKFTLTADEINDLKKLYDGIIMREKENVPNDDLPF